MNDHRVTFCKPAFGASLALAVAVNGCAQSPSTFPAQSDVAAPRSPGVPATHFYGNDFMFTSQPSDSEVVVYRRKRHSDTLSYDKTITSGFSKPMGMVTTPDGRWYVANSGDSNVRVYRTTRKGPQGPVQTLGDSGEVPVNVDAAPDRDLVAVSNEATMSGGGGSVSIYLNRQDEPSRYLTYGSDPVQGEGVAIDSSGNCYWSFNDPKTLTGSIVKFESCSGGGTIFASGILDVGGITFDRSGNLYYVDQIAGIYKCVGPSSCGIFLPIGSIGGLLLPRNINFDSKNPQNLWVADAAGFVEAVNLNGLIVYVLQTVGGILDPPIGVAPAPGS